MLEIRTSGSEGVAGRNPRSYLYPGWRLRRPAARCNSCTLQAFSAGFLLVARGRLVSP